MSTRTMLHGSPDTWLGVNCGHGKLSPDERDAFFPEKPTAQRQALKAKSICCGTDGDRSDCPLREECLDWAIEGKVRHGVWGGKSERERQAIRRDRKHTHTTTHLELVHGAREVDVPENKVARYKGRKATTAGPRRAAGIMARWGETRKSTARLLPGLQKHLLAQAQDQDRHDELIHVSELIRKDFCPRAAYLRIRATQTGKPLPIKEAPRFQLDNIFEEGDRIHSKWQNWFWDQGILWGRFRCHVCDNQWWGTSPKNCMDPACGARREALSYKEVPMSDPDHLVIGHADGEIHDAEGNVLIEIKSIGLGTVRVENPALVAKYTRKYTDEEGVARSYVDHDALWRDLHHPFPGHLRQGYIYLYLRQLMHATHGWPELNKIVFIYEYKPTQAVKEFTVSIDDAYVRERIDDCKDIVFHLNAGFAPWCVEGRRSRCTACKELDALEEQHDAEAEPTTQARRGDTAGQGPGRAEEPERSAASFRRARAARGSHRAERQPADGDAESVHSVGRLLRSAARDGVGR